MVVWSLFGQPGSYRQTEYAAPREVKILLVDDDDNSTNNGNTNFRPYYTEVLNSLSADYDVRYVAWGHWHEGESVFQC